MPRCPWSSLTFPDRSHLYIAQTLGVLAPCYSHHFSRLQCSFQCTVVYDTCFIVCDVHPMCTHHALQCAMFCAPWVAQLYDASSHVSLSVMRKTQCIFHNVHVQCTLCICSTIRREQRTSSCTLWNPSLNQKDKHINC